MQHRAHDVGVFFFLFAQSGGRDARASLTLTRSSISSEPALSAPIER